MSPGRTVDQLRRNPHAVTRLANAAFQGELDSEIPTHLRNIHCLILVDECRVARDDDNPETLDRSVMMSSLMPSLKYSWSTSRLMLANGRTTIEGRSGSDGPTEGIAASVARAATSLAGPSCPARDCSVRIIWSDCGDCPSAPAGGVTVFSRCILRTSTSATTMA